MGAEHPGRVPLVLADRPGVVEQRAQRADADREVGAEQVLAEVVEEDPAHRRLEERGAAGVAGRVPGVLVLLGELHERRRQRRQHRLEVAPDGRHHPPPDEGRRVLQRPDELVDHLHDVDGDRRVRLALEDTAAFVGGGWWRPWLPLR